MKSKNIKSMFLVSALLCAVMVVPTFAAFQSIRISTTTAEATVTGGQLAMSIEIKRRDNDVTVSSLTWSNITAGSGWILADQYILLHSTLTQSGGIRIYTDNAANDANPKFGGSFGENNGAGLIDTTTNTIVLPLAWLIKDNKVDPTTGDPNSNQSWFYFKDKNQSNFWTTTDTKENSTVAKAGYGIHYSQGPGNYGSASSPDYVYIQANFTNAIGGIGGRKYRTTTLRIELYSE